MLGLVLIPIIGLSQNKAQYLSSTKINRDSITRITKISGERKDRNDYSRSMIYMIPIEVTDSILIFNYAFQNSIFAKSISIDDATFLNEADFESSIFRSSASFYQTTFNKPANFHMSTFYKGAEFGDAIFSENSEFNVSSFLKGGSFSEVGFYGGTTFRGTEFKNQADFAMADFRKSADFYGAKFDTARFYAAQFYCFANFSGSNFNGKADFEDVNFTKSVDFSGLNLSEKTEFSFIGARFIDTINFSYNPKIFNEIDFTVANFNDWDYKRKHVKLENKPCYINLYRTDISKLRLDYIHFKLYFSNKQEGLVDDSGVSEDEKNMIYEALLNNFKLHGQLESYKLLDIEYQRFKLDNSNHSFYKWLLKYWWNYGYNKEYIFRWTFGLLFFFSIINMFFINNLNLKIYKIESMPSDIPGLIRIKNIASITANFNYLIKRFWYSLVYTSAIFFKITLKIENFRFGHIAGTIYLIVIYSSGLLCIAYMANFIIQK